MRINFKETGFTLVEVLVVAPVVMLVIITMMSFLFDQYGQLTQQGVQLNLQVEAQTILFTIQDDVFFASAFTTTKNDNLLDSYQPSGGWNAASSPASLIISAPATTKNHRLPDRETVYINEFGCTDDVIEQNSNLQNNIIYFVSGSNLYKRVLTAPASMPTCGASYVKQSCPAANATESCPADRLLTSNLESFTITYYDGDNNIVTLPEAATKATVTINLIEKAFAEDVRANISLTMKRINN